MIPSCHSLTCIFEQGWYLTDYFKKNLCYVCGFCFIPVSRSILWILKNFAVSWLLYGISRRWINICSSPEVFNPLWLTGLKAQLTTAILIIHTCDFSTVAVCRSHMGEMSSPCWRSMSPCLKNSSITRSTQVLYRSSGLVGLLRSEQCTMFWRTCKTTAEHILSYKEKIPMKTEWNPPSHALNSSQAHSKTFQYWNISSLNERG